MPDCPSRYLTADGLVLRCEGPEWTHHGREPESVFQHVGTRNPDDANCHLPADGRRSMTALDPTNQMTLPQCTHVDLTGRICIDPAPVLTRTGVPVCPDHWLWTEQPARRHPATQRGAA